MVSALTLQYLISCKGIPSKYTSLINIPTLLFFIYFIRFVCNTFKFS